ncbi:2Fe-2S iron-sulfur cluster-binding protein [Pseudomonas sp. MIL19]|uniref:2Fe-2S iron-sulfur cluster-binding protein n=1 Tax=Pseudomonas TaxID=286 RepID=UPI0023649BD0|nr:2Fe-2S iron-sulfur cluster-binding protein [Pseudomonas sp. MIL19]MDD2161364.1 2Fe-2S iron-sulfur cluster-binding protein [Pseudomonas sp. MIL19]
MKHQVLIEDTGEQYACDECESVLDGMARLGRRGIPVGCRGGGCGVCKVQIVEGSYAAGVMSRSHVSADEQAAGVVLACRVMPHSDLCVQVLGKMKKTVCRARSGSDCSADPV